MGYTTAERAQREHGCKLCGAASGESCITLLYQVPCEPHAARIAAYRAAHPRGGAKPGLGRPATGITPSRSVSARVSIEVAARFEAHCEARGTTVGARLGEMIREEVGEP